MTTETVDRVEAVGQDMARVERELAENDAQLRAAFEALREHQLAAWRGNADAQAESERLEDQLAELQAERRRLVSIADGLTDEQQEAAHEARLARFEAGRAELEAACQESADAAVAVDRELTRLVGALRRWDAADTRRISLAGRLGLRTNGLMRSARAMQAFLGMKLGKYAGVHTDAGWRRELREQTWQQVDGSFTRTASADAARARKKLSQMQ
jgi:hypothetical protein